MGKKYKSQGDAGMAVPVVVGKSHVYLHTNIESHLTIDESGNEIIYYTYDVEKLTLKEGAERLAQVMGGQ